jgi:tetratricopeptide (TPR) repeat protein
MHSIKKLSLILLSSMLLFVCSINPAASHVEEDNMPDSVAEMEYRILLELEPDNLDVRTKLGLVLFRSRKYDEAANEYNYILKKDPEHVDAILGLARVNTLLSSYQQANSLFHKALSIDPDNMHIYFYFGQALEMQGDTSGAEEIYRKGLAREIKSQSEHVIEERRLVSESLRFLHVSLKNNSAQN